MAAAAAHGLAAAASVCKPVDLLMTLGGDGGLNGMSHGGVELVLRNGGADCLLPVLAPVTLRDARGRVLPVRARIAAGAQASTLLLGGGHRASMTLRWISGPVYPHNRTVRTAQVRLALGGATLSAPLDAVLYGPAGQRVEFERSPMRVMEGMAGDR